MKKIRIISKKGTSGEITYHIQEKRWFRGWVKAKYTHKESGYSYHHYNSLSDAVENVQYYDGSKPTFKVEKEYG